MTATTAAEIAAVAKEKRIDVEAKEKKVERAKRGPIARHWQDTTFKRETALLGFVAWIVLTFYYFSMRDAALVTAFAAGYSTATTMIFLYIGSAFGMDFYAKQISPPKASG